MTTAVKELTPVEKTAQALAAARQKRETVRAKQAENDLALFDLELTEREAKAAHSAALVSEGDTVASRQHLDAARAAIEDAEITKEALVTAVSEAGGAYNVAQQAHATAVVAEQSRIVKNTAPSFQKALASVMALGGVFTEAGAKMVGAAESVNDSNAQRYSLTAFVHDAITAAAKGDAIDIPLALAAKIPEAL